jgi:MFS family permease
MYSRLYRHYVATLLLLVYIFNQVDRRVFDILREPIKREFSLSDTQLGFVGGPALVLFYSLLGVPVARLADRSRRVTIMAVAVALWSAIVTLTAAVGDLSQLTLVRIGVGVGEAGFSAVALSLIGDYETDQHRTQAVSNFMLAIPIAALISNLMGGWVNQFYGWRWVFVIAGVPGILLALLLRGTVQEPPRRLASGTTRDRPPLWPILVNLWRRRSLRHLIIAQGLANIVANAMGWVSVFFIRQHHMATGELGSWLAFTDGIGTMAGIWLSGFMITRFGATDPAIKTRFMAYAGIVVAPVALFVLFSPSKYGALLGYLLLNVPMMFFLAPTAALVQDLAEANVRATMASLFILVQLLAGGVIGTQLVGIFSDALIPLAGNSTNALRWSMALSSMATLWAAAHFWRAAQFMRRESAASPDDTDRFSSIQSVDVHPRS